MINASMMNLGQQRSVIREIFEYAKKRGAEIGSENVLDFSIGNPSVPAPDSVNDTIRRLLNETDSVLLHGYTSAQGDANVRKAMADYSNKTYGITTTADDYYMTVGAAASLVITMKAIVLPEDEIITFAPFFPEYRVFAEGCGAKLVPVMSIEGTLQADTVAMEEAINEHTKAILINSPNNPSGVVLSSETLIKIADILKRKSDEYGHPIYLIADEPYRELVYDDEQVPCILNYYDNSFVCYSFSKSLSLPGERIGYILVSPKMQDNREVYAAVCGAGRVLGYVCAPALFQFVAAECIGQTADISIYKRNRDLLVNSLTEYGFDCVRPDGAFYLFMKTPEADASAFCEKAKKFELLLVPADSFGCPGYVRIAYCVQTEQIERALPAFKALAKEYGLC
ncbi:MAG: pyridoxal phosphate-dependent aminotransferase [Clostridia bacterium]|nr:pyridoxal phosphate-dependent aminotransferase [Clostridia bacterium]